MKQVMTGRPLWMLLGLLTCLTACGGGDGGDGAGALTLSASPARVTLAPTESAEVTLTLTRRGEGQPSTFEASSLPPGVMASFAPAELSADQHATVLTLQVAEDAPLGQVSVEVTVREGTMTGRIEVPVEVVQNSVGGHILHQDGTPITDAIVEVLGHPAVLVDAEGAWKVADASVPYDLRIVRASQGDIHIYRGLEARALELRPFASEGRARPQAPATHLQGSITPWPAERAFAAFWLPSELEPVYASLGLVTANGSFNGPIVFTTPATVDLEVLVYRADLAVGTVTYDGFGTLPLTLADGVELRDLNVPVTPVQTFEFAPTLEPGSELTVSRMCPTVELPHTSTRLLCLTPADNAMPLPRLADRTLSVQLELADAHGGYTRVFARDVGPEVSPTLTVPSPPALLHPSAGASVSPVDLRFRTEAPGTAPITFSFERDDGVQLHVTTGEREIPFPDSGPYSGIRAYGTWEWWVRALPEAQGWEVLGDGGAIGLFENFEHGPEDQPLGAQPPVSRSEVRPLTVRF